MRDLEKDAMYTAIQQHGKFSYRYYKEPESGKEEYVLVLPWRTLFVCKKKRIDLIKIYKMGV